MRHDRTHFRTRNTPVAVTMLKDLQELRRLEGALDLLDASEATRARHASRLAELRARLRVKCAVIKPLSKRP